MSFLITLLATVAVADIVRSNSRIRHPQTAARSMLVGLGAFVTTNYAVGGTPSWWIMCVTLATGVWLFVSDLDLASTPSTSRALEGRQWALVVLGIAISSAIFLQPLSTATASPLDDWFLSLTPSLPAAPTVESWLLLLTVVLFNTETAKNIVRLVLGLPLATEGSKETKGGRLIGPLERILIFALAVAGETLAISAVIAAKGLLRFPEISAAGKDGHDNGSKAEQVIVGSLLSWVIALSFVPLFVV